MNLTNALEKIHETTSGNTMVELEYVAYDSRRNEGGHIKRCVGRKTGSSHDSRSHGTFTMVDEAGNYHTVHVALLMKCNREFVD